jgi:beta-galactosidase
MEKKIIRDAGATQPITTNMMSAFPATDYWAWADELDVISDDSYPDPRNPLAFRETAFARDLMRSLKPGTPWILMEQAANQVNWRLNNAAKAPGQMAALSMQAVGRGADGVLFFQWRQSWRGSEKFHSAMLPHAGTSTRTFREVQALGAELAGLGDLPAPGGEARVAIVLDWHAQWAVDQPDHPAEVDHLEQVRGWHAAFHALNIQVDLVRPTGPFDAYALVVAPALYLIADAGPLAGYGGCLLTTGFTDVVDRSDRFVPGGFARRLGLGLTVTDIAGVLGDEAVVSGDELQFSGEGVREDLRLEGAEVVASFVDGAPALTRFGERWRLATLAGPEARLALARFFAGRLGIEPVVAGLPPNVEACRRGDVVTVINHNPAPVEVGDEVLGPYEYRVRN